MLVGVRTPLHPSADVVQTPPSVPGGPQVVGTATPSFDFSSKGSFAEQARSQLRAPRPMPPPPPMQPPEAPDVPAGSGKRPPGTVATTPSLPEPLLGASRAVGSAAAGQPTPATEPVIPDPFQTEPRVPVLAALGETAQAPLDVSTFAKFQPSADLPDPATSPPQQTGQAPRGALAPSSPSGKSRASSPTASVVVPSLPHPRGSAPSALPSDRGVAPSLSPAGIPRSAASVSGAAPISTAGATDPDRVGAVEPVQPEGLSATSFPVPDPFAAQKPRRGKGSGLATLAQRFANAMVDYRTAVRQLERHSSGAGEQRTVAL